MGFGAVFGRVARCLLHGLPVVVGRSLAGAAVGARRFPPRFCVVWGAATASSAGGPPSPAPGRRGCDKALVDGSARSVPLSAFAPQTSPDDARRAGGCGLLPPCVTRGPHATCPRTGGVASVRVALVSSRLRAGRMWHRPRWRRGSHPSDGGSAPTGPKV